VHHWYNNINSQLDADNNNFINNFKQLNMFRAKISPILRSIIPQSSAPEDRRNYRPKHVELFEVLKKIIILASGWIFILLFLMSVSLSVRMKQLSSHWIDFIEV